MEIRNTRETEKSNLDLDKRIEEWQNYINNKKNINMNNPKE